jgi:aryl-phospho-beta-D-glucosidase BglC (GH1 family)
MIGVNLAGAEFGELGRPHGTGYIYPDASYINYYADNGMELIRLPFKWERLQEEAGGELNSAELGRIREFVDHAASRGMTVVLDVHNYGHYYDQLLGVEVPNSTFADLWGKLATEFKSDQNVWFGLMNEPHKQSATDWIETANAGIAAIRDAGATQKIMVPGSYWSGSYSWTTSDNHTVVGGGVVDPLNNYAFEVHLYFDGDNSGTSPNAVSATVGVERVEAITAWAKETGNQLFLGEFGVSRDALSIQALDNLMAHMAANAEVWAGAAYWAAGPWWGDYMFSIEPRNGEDAPQLAVLQKYDLGGDAFQPTPSPLASVEIPVEEDEAIPEEEAVPEEETVQPVTSVVIEAGAEEEAIEIGDGPVVSTVDEQATPVEDDLVAESSEDQPFVNTAFDEPIVEEVAGSPPESQGFDLNSTVAIRNAGDGADHFSEGESFGITFSVKNAAAGQTFQLWMANTADADDFDNSLEEDLAAALPAGVTYDMLGDKRVEITLTEGSYDFTITRGIALDGVEENTDQSPWAEGNQEQVDFWISDFTGGLTSTSNVASYWITDVPAEATSVDAVVSQPLPVDAEPAEDSPAASEAETGCGPSNAPAWARADAFFEKFMARFEERADEWFSAKLAGMEASGAKNGGKFGGNGVFQSEGFEAANSPDHDLGMAKVGGPSTKGMEIAQLRAGSSSFDWLADPMIDAANDQCFCAHSGTEYA